MKVPIKLKRVLIVGAGGHGQVVADILNRLQESDGSITPIGYVDDEKELQSRVVLGLPVLGDLGDIASIPHERLVIAIGENEVRREVFLRLASREECLQPAVHPGATLAAGVALGAGTVAAAGVVVNPGSTIGTSCILNTACTIDHHNHLADYVHVAPGAHLGGDVCIGEGSLGQFGAFSFNGNKIVTTSQGGMLVSNDSRRIEAASFLASQAKDPAAHYQHSTAGYNYTMSNVLAAVGRAQLKVLPERIESRRNNFIRYQKQLGQLPGIGFMPEASYGRCTRWLTCITVDPQLSGTTREEIRKALDLAGIESRPIWKPLHLQPVFEHCPRRGGGFLKTSSSAVCVSQAGPI